MVLNSFRQTWIVYLSRKEKIAIVIYGFLVFLTFGFFDVLVSQMTLLNKSLLYYSHGLREFVLMMATFGTVYVGMTFVSTLFHLPTAEAFDRKITEVASLHNLTRLVRQVFDFDELVGTVTRMTVEVCEARSAWLEIVEQGERALPTVGDRTKGPPVVKVAATQNISREQIADMNLVDGTSLRDAILDQKENIYISDVTKDRRIKQPIRSQLPIRSLLIVPLVSHTEVIGILYVAKDFAHGFDKDDIDVVSAFADQATIAIENSRLIKESLEKERLYREMMVAQEMQRRLLPQSLPLVEGVELTAVSSPAFEVGGDYYDFVRLDKHRLGIVVGDVSGKGVSAAFYMAEVKGIFQSLSKICTSPKEFLIKANHALRETIDRKSFVSMVYSILDTQNGELTLSRAGHCPVLYLSGERVEYVRPVGLGLGLSDGAILDGVTEEYRIQLKKHDICVFYTDGITEARNEAGEEFGYDRLLRVVRASREKSASQIEQDVLNEIYGFLHSDVVRDDVTIVVLRWLKSIRQQSRV